MFNRQGRDVGPSILGAALARFRLLAPTILRQAQSTAPCAGGGGLMAMPSGIPDARERLNRAFVNLDALELVFLEDEPVP